MDIEKELAAALRVQDPGPAFTRAVLAQLPRTARAPAARRWHLRASLAASVLLATAGAWLIDQQMQQQRIVVASEQLALALSIASAQLNDVQQKISRHDELEDGI